MREFLKMLFVDKETQKISFTAFAVMIGLYIMIDAYVLIRYTDYLISIPSDKLALFLDFTVRVVTVAVAGTVTRYGVGRLSHMRFSRSAIASPSITPKPKTKIALAPSTNPKPYAPQKTGNYFDISDFDSSEGIPMPTEVRNNVIILIDNLNVLREALNTPIIITSGYRSENHPIERRKTKPGYHITGMAADIKAEGYSNKEVAAKIIELINEGKMIPGGVSANYATHTHYDIRGTFAAW